MFTAQLKATDLSTFVEYLAENWEQQLAKHPSNACANFMAVSMDGRKVLAPDGEFHWQHDGHTFAISIAEEGAPVATMTAVPAYFVRCKVSHDEYARLADFVTHAISHKAPVKDQQIQVFHNKSRGYWDMLGAVYAQPLDHVYIEKTQKNAIVDSINEFIADKERYHAFGRPFKLTMLLTGPPGCGKTSLVKALALHYKRKLYVVNFSKSLTDDNLIGLIHDVEENIVLLFEDIDAYFQDRRPVDINISFSCLINAMDGTYASDKGTLVFLTANNPQLMDRAMIRHGRVDRIVSFGPPSKSQIQSAYQDIVGSQSAFSDFYAKVKGVDGIGMAAIVDHLFRNAKDPMCNVDVLLEQAQVRAGLSMESVDKLYI
jgi:chaperone BCS1